MPNVSYVKSCCVMNKVMSCVVMFDHPKMKLVYVIDWFAMVHLVMRSYKVMAWYFFIFDTSNYIEINDYIMLFLFKRSYIGIIHSYNLNDYIVVF